MSDGLVLTRTYLVTSSQVYGLRGHEAPVKLLEGSYDLDGPSIQTFPTETWEPCTHGCISIFHIEWRVFLDVDAFSASDSFAVCCTAIFPLSAMKGGFVGWSDFSFNLYNIPASSFLLARLCLRRAGPLTDFLSSNSVLSITGGTMKPLASTGCACTENSSLFYPCAHRPIWSVAFSAFIGPVCVFVVSNGIECRYLSKEPEKF